MERIHDKDTNARGPGGWMAAGKKVRIAAIADIHCSPTSVGRLRSLFSAAAETADVLLLCGDLTDYGSLDEAKLLAKELGTFLQTGVVLGVLGNHDYESGKQKEVTQILADAGVVMLDGNTFEAFGIGFTGVKGFGGGFVPHVLESWGEEAIKAFVREAENEAAKLQEGLSKLKSTQRVVLFHYSPIRATVEGEAIEIFPLLGSSRLEAPLNLYHVTAAFHGHAHKGCPQGRTHGNVPVYNVSLPLLARLMPERPPLRVIEVAAEPYTIKQT